MTSFQCYVAESGPDECWEWKASKDKDGYGRWAGRRAHRVAYALRHGPIPEGLWVLHKCDNPSCCNPNHLFLGTVDDNNKDMHRKGRGPYVGEANPSCKLTDEQAALVKADKRPSRAVGLDYGISHRQVLNIRNGKQRAG